MIWLLLHLNRNACIHMLLGSQHVHRRFMHIMIAIIIIIYAPPRQRNLSSKSEDHHLKVLFDLSSSPATVLGFSLVFSLCLGLAFGHANSPAEITPRAPEFQVALKRWLELDTSQTSSCSFCPLTPLGHHALMCKSGVDLKLSGTIH